MRDRPRASGRRAAGDAGAIVRQLTRDHKRVLRAVAATEAFLTGPRRGPIRGTRETRLRGLLTMLKEQFASHLAAEDEILFPALAETLPTARSILAPLHAEHSELQEMRARLERTLDERPSEARDEDIVVQVRDLTELLRIHIRKEETVVLSVAARLLTPQEIDAAWGRLVGGTGSARTTRRPKASTKGASR